MARRRPERLHGEVDLVWERLVGPIDGVYGARLEERLDTIAKILLQSWLILGAILKRCVGTIDVVPSIVGGISM